MPSSTTTTTTATTSTTNASPAATTTTRSSTPAALEVLNNKRVAAALTAPNAKFSNLMTTVLLMCTYSFLNSGLLSAVNPFRCSFWNASAVVDNNNEIAISDCSVDHAWILNWYSFAKFHTAILLSFLGASAVGYAWLETKIGFLAVAILTCYLAGGIGSIRLLNPAIAGFQGTVMLTLMVVILYWIQEQELQPGSAFLISPHNRSRSISISQRRKLALPTLTVGIQFLLSLVQVADMAFRTSNDGYLGDDSSVTFQSISSLAIIDMMLVPLVMLFALFFGQVEHQKALLTGHLVALFVIMLMMSSTQGDRMNPDQVRFAMVANFGSMLMSAFGGGALQYW